MQSLDQFKFSDDIMMDASEKLLFGGQNDYIHLDTDLKAVAAADYVVDAASEIMLDFGAGSDGLVLKEAGAVIGSIKKGSSTDLEIKSGATSAIQFTGANVDVRGDLTVTGGNITNALQFDGDVSLEGGNDGLKFVYAGKNTIDIPDNQATALIIEEGVNSYMTFNSTDNSEEISLSQDTRIIDDKKIEFGNGADVSIEYDEDGTDELRFAGAAAIFEQDVKLAGVDGALQFTNAGENSIKIPDNQASALIVEEADNAYITFNSTDGSEAITFNKAVTFSGGISNGGTISTTDIDGGTIDGTVIGATTQAAGDLSLIHISEPTRPY